MPIRMMVLAHGNLGPWDELIGLAAFGIFLIMLAAPPVLTWWRKQRVQRSTHPRTQDVSPDQQPASTAKRRGSHYRLD